MKTLIFSGPDYINTIKSEEKSNSLRILIRHSITK